MLFENLSFASCNKPFTSLKCWTLLVCFRVFFLDPLVDFSACFLEWGGLCISSEIHWPEGSRVEALVILCLLHFRRAQGTCSSRAFFLCSDLTLSVSCSHRCPWAWQLHPLPRPCSLGCPVCGLSICSRGPFSPLDLPFKLGVPEPCFSRTQSVFKRGRCSWCTVFVFNLVPRPNFLDVSGMSVAPLLFPVLCSSFSLHLYILLIIF